MAKKEYTEEQEEFWRWSQSCKHLAMMIGFAIESAKKDNAIQCEKALRIIENAANEANESLSAHPEFQQRVARENENEVDCCGNGRFVSSSAHISVLDFEGSFRFSILLNSIGMPDGWEPCDRISLGNVSIADDETWPLVQEDVLNYSSFKSKEMASRIEQEGVKALERLGDSNSFHKSQQGKAKNALSDLPLEPPSEKAKTAWMLKEFRGIKTQKEIAEKMAERGYSTDQAGVSRLLKQFNDYLKRGGIAPTPPAEARVEAVDPSLIDMGFRSDGRTERQRLQKKPD